MVATLFIDADACPVKDECYKVAARHGFKTFVVSNSWIRVPQTPVIEQVVVEAGPDVADDWIAERCAPGDVVVTNDIPLADRVLKAGGAAVAPNGRVFSADMIGSALASRSIGEHLRSMGEVTKGPAAFAGFATFTALAVATSTDAAFRRFGCHGAAALGAAAFGTASLRATAFTASTTTAPATTIAACFATRFALLFTGRRDGGSGRRRCSGPAAAGVPSDHGVAVPRWRRLPRARARRPSRGACCAPPA